MLRDYCKPKFPYVICVNVCYYSLTSNTNPLVQSAIKNLCYYLLLKGTKQKQKQNKF